MAHVFLSYSREDEAEAKQIAAALEETGLEVWWDRTIPPGKTFDQVIEEALDSSSWALVLWSETSIESNWVKAEADEALRRGILVPVLIDNVRPPLAFRRIEAAELQDWDGDSTNPEFGNLLKVMGKDAPPPPKVAKPSPAKPQPPVDPPTQPYPPPNRMATGTKVAIGLGAAILLVLATVVATNLGGGGGTDPVQERIDAPIEDATQQESRPSKGDFVQAEPNESERPSPKELSVKQDTLQVLPEPRRDLKARAATPEPPATGTITLRYAGDAYNCTLDVQITVAGQTITPQTNIAKMYNIPVGPARYSVTGVISCPTVGVCNASGNGQINAVNGGLYDLNWQNTSYAHCEVSFIQSG